METGRAQGDEQAVLKLLQFIGTVSGGKSVTQVALGYLTAKGAIAIPGPMLCILDQPMLCHPPTHSIQNSQADKRLLTSVPAQHVHAGHSELRLGCAFAGAIPIPGAKNVDQVKEHLGALDLELDENEVAVIDERLDAVK